jgi:aminoglycoside phosphotransferase (APT) family kinase protein
VVTNSLSADKATWKVVSPAPPLPVAKADALLAQWRGGRTVVEVEPLKGGIMNWNYRLRLSGSPERFVLRFYDRNPASCAKEMRVLSLVRDDMPVPAVHHVEATGVDGFPPFCVLEFIDAISLRALRRGGDMNAVAMASYDAGRLLPRLMAHRFERSGVLSAELAVVDGPFAGASLATVVEHFDASALFRERLDPSFRARLLAFVQSNEALHAGTGATVSLVHGDFNSPNIFVRETAGKWRVAAILDWEFAFAGSVFSDVGNMLRYERPGQPRYDPYFSRGLIDGGLALPDDWFLRARLADLPALCELLTRDDVPNEIVAELRDLIAETVHQTNS